MKEAIITICFFAAISGYAQKAEIVKFDYVQKILESQSNEIQVINFWATWCAPCVKEIHLFETLHKDNPNMEVILINLDFADAIEKVNKFVNKNKLTSKVLLLDEIDYNKWIDKIDKTWSGAIPATLILNFKTGKRIFVEKELAEGDLQQLIAKVI